MKSFKHLFNESKSDTIIGWHHISGNLYLNKDYILKYFKYEINNLMISDLIQMIDEIKKNKKKYTPKENEVLNREAYVWRIDAGSGDLTYKNNQGMFESQLTLLAVNPTSGNDIEDVIIRGIRSKNVEDIYIHNIDTEDLEKIIDKFLPKKIKWKVFAQMIDTHIDFGVHSNFHSISFEDKKIKFKGAKEYIDYIGLDSNEGFINGFRQFKSKAIDYLNDWLRDVKNPIDRDGFKKDDETIAQNKVAMEIILYMIDMAKKF